ncbi:endonuclease/exonuclease/phosphatase family protein [Methylibium rhizosphaerae]|uniref:endonuclease/exonuclease/phosphatase family protein n=1 Tax=Methylibium rhizosphaerae TaxID=2570323 RepID=UPI00112E634C|nr:endonuclease/exonuclease/phosphatase family protein [Methylibium rhizosphaerae]
MADNIRDISFASFNLYNLQVVGAPTHHGAPTFTEDTYQARLEWASAILHQLDADVIAFQELWSARALRDLFDVAGLADTYELHFIGEAWYDIAVAAAVRKPWRVADKRLHKSFPDDFRLIKRAHDEAGADVDRTDDDIDVQISMFSRTVMELTLACDGADNVPPVCVLCAHLKSKLATDLDPVEAAIESLKPHRAALGAALSTIRRTAEAAALRMILTDLTRNTDRAVALVGDLNDGAHSNTLAILSAQPPFRRRHKSRTGERSDAGMYPVTFLQALSDFQDVAYSHVYDGVREQLDHVLVSEQFYDHSKNRFWSFKTQEIWNDHLGEDGPNGPKRPTSDHGIVCARFAWDPAIA